MLVGAGAGARPMLCVRADGGVPVRQANALAQWPTALLRLAYLAMNQHSPDGHRVCRSRSLPGLAE